MREEGFVKTVSGEMCEVIIKRKTACGENCASCKGGCEVKNQVCISQNVIGAKTGDRVLIEMDSARVLKSAFLVYILPILAFLTAFTVASENGGGNFVSAVWGLAGALLVFVCVGVYSARHKKDYLSRVVEII